MVPMPQLRVGDRILTADRSGALSFAPVIFLPHDSDNKEPADFIHMETLGGLRLRASANHLVRSCVGGMGHPPRTHGSHDDDAAHVASSSGESRESSASPRMIRMDELRVGSCVATAAGEDWVGSLEQVEEDGVFTAITTNEFLLVGGVHASPFAIYHTPLHVFYHLHRSLYRLWPSLLESPTLKQANAALGTVADVAIQAASNHGRHQIRAPGVLEGGTGKIAVAFR